MQAAAALIVCFFLARTVVKYADRALDRIRVEKSLHTFVKSALKIALYTVAALIAADALGIPITSLVALLGVVGLAVSLSAQNMLMNLLGGVLILTTKPFIVGDYIASGGAEGTVVDIGLIYTQLATIDDKIVFMPNGTLSSGQITNYARSRKRRLDMNFSTTFDADPDAVGAMILKAFDDPRVLSDPEPAVRISGYSDGVNFVAKAWVLNPDYWNLYYDVNERVGRAFKDAGIRMPGRQYEISLNNKNPKS
jgi:small conductance mechanosensitive channel